MKLYVLAACGLLLGGCATVARGTNDTWTVNTTPGGAAVKTSNQFFCDSTPCTFKMPRKAEFDVTVTKAGYKTWTGHVTHHVSGAGSAGFVGNALIGGVIGAGVDVATGATLNLVPNPLVVTLEKDGEPAEQHAAAAPPSPQPMPAKVATGPAASPAKSAAVSCKRYAIRVATDPSQNVCAE